MSDPFPSLSSSPQTHLGVLLFTDIVGSTDLKKPENLGGPAYQRLLERHNTLFESTLREHPNSRIIKHTGDGYFAEFPTASLAVRFALVFQSRMGLEPWGPTPLSTRVGIYVGEYQLTTQAGQPDIVGRTADLAARLMSLAVGGQILLTRQAFDDARQYISESPLKGTPPILWLVHGPYKPKGAEPFEVCEVGIQGFSPLTAPQSSDKVARVLPEGEEEMFGPGYPRPAVGLAIPDHTDWVLSSKLGEGGFGEVWLGENRKLAELRVFKFCFNAKRLRSLQREFTLFRLLRSSLGDRPDIARLYNYRLPTDSQSIPPPYYLESEYAAGGSLDLWANAFPGGLAQLPEADRLELLAKVADATAAAHSIGIRHKDIKPGNVLLRHPPGQGPIAPILSDFGIGFIADDTELQRLNITLAGFDGRTQAPDAFSSRTGTRLYAPPEQLEGREFTTHGDVYALGVLLYQLAIADLAKPFTPEWRDDIPDLPLQNLIASATTRNASQRPAASELAAAVRNLPTTRAQAADLARQQLLAQTELAARRRRKRLLTLSVPVVVVSALLVLLLVLTSTRVSEQLGRQLGESAIDRVRVETRAFLSPAVSLSDLYNHRITITHSLSPTDLDGWTSTLLEDLQTNPSVASICFATPDGNTVWLRRNAGRLEYGRSKSAAENNTREWVVSPRDTTLSPLGTNTYVATTRPWFKLATASRQPLWTPISSVSPDESGGTVTNYTRSVHAPDGAFLGVLAIDVALASISDFLKSLPIARDGALFLVDDQSMVVAASDGPTNASVTTRHTLTSSPSPAANALSPFLNTPPTSNASPPLRTQIGVHPVRVLSATLNPFPGIDWKLLISLPEATFMTEARSAQRSGTILSILLAFLFIALAVYLARHG